MDSLWIPIAYHVWWPGNGDDPMCWADYEMNETRNNYYGNNYTPHMFSNGKDSESVTSYWARHPREYLDTISPLEIQMSGSRSEQEIDLDIEIVMKKLIPGSDLRLFVAATMDTIDYPGSPNGLTEHHHAVMGMLAGNHGTEISLEIDTLLIYSYSWTVPDNWKNSISFSWNIKDLRLVAWVQNYQSQEVLQAEELVF